MTTFRTDGSNKTTAQGKSAPARADATASFVPAHISDLIKPPPLMQRLDDRISELPAPVPQLWAVRMWVHAVGSTGITAVQVGHMLFRDQLIALLAQWGVPQDRLAGFREQHERLFGAFYDRARNAHWYI
ncbi:hypothetical protein AB0N05_34235 [Nocardia sp. NPDC051030]|uniref:hypothetical protein n=1 Tax=Nocardia sp. NPDC051030 TaxID=3155162 RepID=UPI00343F583E